jgi:acyl-CoA dehydrogenase
LKRVGIEKVGPLRVEEFDYTETGQGELAAKIAKEVAGARGPGGSEDVLFDLAIRQLYKNYQRASKDKAKL